ncbi:MAG: hypothetical protein N3A58_03765 [Spirochaetes bacterium]|nr:hypothetical protein [Spirochaetota bacterium]
MLKILFNIIFFVLLIVFVILNINYKTEINFYGKIYKDVSIVTIVFISFGFSFILFFIINLIYKIESNKIKSLKDKIEKNKIKNNKKKSIENIDINLLSKKIIKNDKDTF